MKRLTFCMSALVVGSAVGLIQALESPYQSKVSYPEPNPITASFEELPPIEKPKAKSSSPSEAGTIKHAFFVDEAVSKSTLPPVTSSVIQISAQDDGGEVEQLPLTEDVQDVANPTGAGPESGTVYEHGPAKVACWDDYSSCDSRWMFGLGFYVMQPRWERDPAVRMNTGLLGAAVGEGGGEGAYLENPELYYAYEYLFEDYGPSDGILNNTFDYDIVPRFIFGYAFGDCTGFRGAYWGFEDETHSDLSIDFFLEQDDGDEIIEVLFDMAMRSKIEMHVLDLEGFKEIRKGPWSALMSAGIRVAELRQNYRFSTDLDFFRDDEGDVTEFDFSAVATHSSRFRGLGPTAAIELRRQCGCRGLALYGSLRGTVLVGRHRQEGTFNFSFDTETPEDLPFIDLIVESDQSRDDIIPVGEAELGFEWTRSFGCNRVLFFQGALVSQGWSEAGSSCDFGLFHLGARGDLDLFGLKFTTGVVY